MRLVTFLPPDNQARAGVLIGAAVLDLAVAAPLLYEDIPSLRWDMLSLLRGDQDEVTIESAAEIVAAAVNLLGGEGLLSGEGAGNGRHDAGMAGSLALGGATMFYPLDQVRLLAPLPRPASIRDFYAFEQHVATARGQRGQEVPPEWYRFPAFYFSNHGAVYAPHAEIPMPRSDALDYELELACVIGREGRDIHPDDALDYIAGFTIMNDWSARDIQADERPIGLGPAKAKDFATSLGPWLVTTDELELYFDDDGKLSLTMIARVNGIERSRGNAASMFYSFAEIIAHASRDATLYPGDVLGSGTVGGGCLLELTGVPAIDASQTTLPEKWRQFPVYQWNTATEFKLEERLRGMGLQRPEGLRIRRTLWLDEDGAAFTTQDVLTGAAQQLWRLDAAPGHNLGAVKLNGQPQLITQNPATGRPGIEIRERNLRLESVGRSTAPTPSPPPAGTPMPNPPP
ncbi:fumarylacetoacetate hydrolase family protein, partial [Candidatus Gracilibacteria bacterium]|nr:fumarylacetoacetate hydrolase family protein [Candidatus Gracilibacteria bacterium]